VAAGLTAFYARGWIAAERAAILASIPEKGPETLATFVLVAKEDLPAGTFVKPTAMTWQAWPEDGVTEDYMVQGKREMAELEGAVVRHLITAGQPITESRVVHPGDRGFLAAVLNPGMRGVSVPVNATSGIAGFVFPGDWVDLLLTIRMNVKEEDTGNNETRYFSETLLTDVRVLAVDQNIENEKGEVNVAKTATLEVTPKQAEMIAIGLEMGSLSLSLHSLAREQDRFARLARDIGADPGETTNERSYTTDIDVYYMLGDPDGLVRRNGKSKKNTVNVLHGEKADTAKF
jgi:pilus assembly protein CpaB